MKKQSKITGTKKLTVYYAACLVLPVIFNLLYLPRIGPGPAIYKTSFGPLIYKRTRLLGFKTFSMDPWASYSVPDP